MIATGAWTSPGSKGEFPAHTPTELACLAGIAVPTASGHLLKLGRGRLVSVVAQGLHATTASPHGGLARMLEEIMVVAAEPAPAITRATAAHRSRAAPGSDLSRSSRRRTRRRHHECARHGRAFGRRRNGHRSRARAVLRRGLSAEWRSGTTGCTAGRALTGASVALISRVSWVRPCSSERYRPSSFVGARAAAPLMSRKGRMTCCSGWILSDSREQQLCAYRRSSIDAKNGTPRFLGRGFSLRYGMVLIQELRP
jgi:hypothetical protein